jgi:beta-fructofuranosidase
MKNIIFFTWIISIFPASTQDKSEDYNSKVPKCKFANKLAEQEKELCANPLITRFAESREKMKNDRYRPIYHFVSPEENLNDPNGLSFWKGRWHLFYQAYPTEDTRQHWSHAVSDDLVNGKDLPYAIYLGHEYQSSWALLENNRAIAMYHGTQLGIMVTTSSDPLLLNWAKIGNGADISITPNNKDLPYYVYDPIIWEKDGLYYSISGGIIKDTPSGSQLISSYLIKSEDLKTWEYMYEFIEKNHFMEVGDDGVCPYFRPIGKSYIFPFYRHISGGQYFLGDYNKQRDKFVATGHGKFNFEASKTGGLDPPSAAPAENVEDVIILFNMNAAKPPEGWYRITSLPRRLTLKGKDAFLQEPAGDIELNSHLSYKQVILRLILVSGCALKVISHLFGGQGTIKVIHGHQTVKILAL